MVIDSSFFKVVHGIISQLVLFHQNNQFHGNFRISVKVNTTFSKCGSLITLYPGKRQVKPPPLGSTMTPDKIHNGIRPDVEALRLMVLEVVTKFRNPNQIVPTWDLFWTGQIYLTTQNMTLHEVKCAFYNFSSPIFVDKKGAYSLTLKLHEIRKRNWNNYNFFVDLTHGNPMLYDGI